MWLCCCLFDLLEIVLLFLFMRFQVITLLFELLEKTVVGACGDSISLLEYVLKEEAATLPTSCLDCR